MLVRRFTLHRRKTLTGVARIPGGVARRRSRQITASAFVSRSIYRRRESRARRAPWCAVPLAAPGTLRLFLNSTRRTCAFPAAGTSTSCERCEHSAPAETRSAYGVTPDGAGVDLASVATGCRMRPSSSELLWLPFPSWPGARPRGQKQEPRKVKQSVIISGRRMLCTGEISSDLGGEYRRQRDPERPAERDPGIRARPRNDDRGVG